MENSEKSKDKIIGTTERKKKYVINRLQEDEEELRRGEESREKK